MSPAFHNIQWRTYVIFAVFCFAMTFHVFFLYPETAGRTLEEIDMVFDTDVKPWRTNLIEDRFEDELDKKGAKEPVSDHKEVA